jgi:hypothetical protein
VLWVAAGFALIALIDLIPLIKKRFWHTMRVFLAVFAAALTLSALLAGGVAVPSVMLWLGSLLKAIGISY